MREVIGVGFSSRVLSIKGREEGVKNQHDFPLNPCPIESCLEARSHRQVENHTRKTAISFMTFLQQPALCGPRLPSFLRIRNLSARAQARRTNPDLSLSIVQTPESQKDSRFPVRSLCDSAHADESLAPLPAVL